MEARRRRFAPAALAAAAALALALCGPALAVPCAQAHALTAAKAAKPSVAQATVTAPAVTYKWKPAQVVPKVVLDGVVLKPYRDYLMEFSDNETPGRYGKVTVIGCGNYTGEKRASFLVRRRDIYNVEATIPAQTYTGRAVRPTPAASEAGRSLVANVDYRVVYYDNIDAGTARAVLTGYGTYTGVKEVTFAIGRASLSGAAIRDIPDQRYTGKAVKPAVRVEVDGRTLSEGRDYTVAYKDNVKAGTATVTVTGKGNYTGSKSATFEIAGAAGGSVSGATVQSIAAKTYTGKKITPAPAVKVAGTTLKLNRDYTLSYKNNVNAGTATVTVKGKGSYTGSKTVRFKIAPAPIAKATAKCANKNTSGLAAVKSPPAVSFGGAALKEGRDYTVSYKDNVRPGTATATVTGKGNFKGSRKVTYKLANLGDDLARKACEISYSRYTRGAKGTKAYIAACKKANIYKSATWIRSCNAAMCAAVRASGYDKGYPVHNWDSRWNVMSARSFFNYLQKGEKHAANSNKTKRWTCIGTYPAVKGKLLPGDVLLTLNKNHTWMYVGMDIANEVYKAKLKGTEADKGAPVGGWVQAHATSLTAPCIEKSNESFNNNPNPVRVYRCTDPMCK